jgi:hypothetical protein
MNPLRSLKEEERLRKSHLNKMSIHLKIIPKTMVATAMIILNQRSEFWYKVRNHLWTTKTLIS